MLKDFKAFALKGNVVDLAVGIIIGAAFGKIVSSLVDDVLMPFFGILIGGVNFSGLSVQIGEANLVYGSFIQSIVDFLIIAFSLFIVIKVMNRLKKKEVEKESAPPAPSKEAQLLEEIRDLLKREPAK